MSAGPYSIGSSHWPGVSKLIEEMGELQQVLGKLIAVNGGDQHWDEAGPLNQRIASEMGDVLAAIRFVRAHNPLFGIDQRAEEKYATFCYWHREQGDAA